MKILIKKCLKCGAEGIEKFNKDRKRKDGLHAYCKECNKEYKRQLRLRIPSSREAAILRSKRWREENPDRASSAIREATLKKKYGITQKQYNDMLLSQDNKCHICGVEPTKQRLHVDHNHLTGKVRALLCQSCNTSIGKMKESPSLLRKLADYLEMHNA